MSALVPSRWTAPHPSVNTTTQVLSVLARSGYSIQLTQNYAIVRSVCRYSLPQHAHSTLSVIPVKIPGAARCPILPGGNVIGNQVWGTGGRVGWGQLGFGFVNRQQNFAVVVLPPFLAAASALRSGLRCRGAWVALLSIMGIGTCSFTYIKKGSFIYKISSYILYYSNSCVSVSCCIPFKNKMDAVPLSPYVPARRRFDSVICARTTVALAHGRASKS